MKGLSLSFCVRDIARGVVKEADVEVIIACTSCPTRERFTHVLYTYQRNFWRGFPEASAIALRLWDEGLIYQPRLVGPCSIQLLGTDSHWMGTRQTTPGNGLPPEGEAP